jgi:hypothetical protein
MTAALALKPIEALTNEAITDPFARRVLADEWAERGRVDIAALMLDLLPRDTLHIELRARAFAACCMSACWFWPHSDFVLVSERPRRLEKHANGSLKIVEWDGWKVEP